MIFFDTLLQKLAKISIVISGLDRKIKNYVDILDKISKK
jgi:hypothetical protein